MPITVAYTLSAGNVVLTLTETAFGNVDGASNLDTAGYVPYVSAAGVLSIDKTAAGQLFWDATNHRLGIGMTNPAQKLGVTGNIQASGTILGTALNLGSGSMNLSTTIGLQMPLSLAPASAAATGIAGQLVYDTGFIYVCTATNTWKRVAIATW